MKATIDGFVIEGTAEEIIEFKKLYDENRLKEKTKPYINPPFNPFGSGSVDAVGKVYTSTTPNPYTVKFDQAKDDTHSWQGIDTLNPDIKVESNGQ